MLAWTSLTLRVKAGVVAISTPSAFISAAKSPPALTFSTISSARASASRCLSCCCQAAATLSLISASSGMRAGYTSTTRKMKKSPLLSSVRALSSPLRRLKARRVSSRTFSMSVAGRPSRPAPSASIASTVFIVAPMLRAASSNGVPRLIWRSRSLAREISMSGAWVRLIASTICSRTSASGVTTGSLIELTFITCQPSGERIGRVVAPTASSKVGSARPGGRSLRATSPSLMMPPSRPRTSFAAFSNVAPPASRSASLLAFSSLSSSTWSTSRAPGVVNSLRRISYSSAIFWSLTLISLSMSSTRT